MSSVEAGDWPETSTYTGKHKQNFQSQNIQFNLKSVWNSSELSSKKNIQPFLYIQNDLKEIFSYIKENKCIIHHLSAINISNKPFFSISKQHWRKSWLILFYAEDLNNKYAWPRFLPLMFPWKLPQRKVMFASLPQEKTLWKLSDPLKRR